MPLLLVCDPTARHAFAALHDTPLSWLSAAPAGLGVLCIDQLEPFQASAEVSRMLVPVL